MRESRRGVVQTKILEDTSRRTLEELGERQREIDDLKLALQFRKQLRSEVQSEGGEQSVGTAASKGKGKSSAGCRSTQSREKVLDVDQIRVALLRRLMKRLERGEVHRPIASASLLNEQKNAMRDLRKGALAGTSGLNLPGASGPGGAGWFVEIHFNYKTELKRRRNVSQRQFMHKSVKIELNAEYTVESLKEDLGELFQVDDEECESFEEDTCVPRTHSLTHSFIRSFTHSVTVSLFYNKCPSQDFWEPESFDAEAPVLSSLQALALNQEKGFGNGGSPPISPTLPSLHWVYDPHKDKLQRMREKPKALRKLFRHFDTDKNGSLDVTELKGLIHTLEGGSSLSRIFVHALHDELKDAEKGGVTLSGVKKMIASWEATVERELAFKLQITARDAFSQFDLDNSKEIGVEEFVDVIQMIHPRFPRDKAEAVFYKLDSDNTETVTFDEFEKEWPLIQDTVRRTNEEKDTIGKVLREEFDIGASNAKFFKHMPEPLRALYRTFFMFLAMLFFFLYVNNYGRIVRFQYQIVQSIDNALFSMPFLTPDSQLLKFDEIGSISDMWSWCEGPLQTMLFPDSKDNTENLVLLDTKMTPFEVVFHQYRNSNSTCPGGATLSPAAASAGRPSASCMVEYSLATTDTATIGGIANVNKSGFVYRNAKGVWPDIPGRIASYDDGGYCESYSFPSSYVC